METANSRPMPCVSAMSAQMILGGPPPDLFAITFSIKPLQPSRERANPFNMLVDVDVGA